MRQTVFVSCLISLGILFAATSSEAQSEWIHTTHADPLQAKPVDIFTLPGTYVTPPETQSARAPRLVIRCDHKFIDGYLHVGGVVERVSAVKTVLGYVATLADGAEVEMRGDDQKAPITVYWKLSNDFQALFFPNAKFLAEVLTGKRSGKISDSRQLIRSLYIGVTEAIGGRILMHFDMPTDTSELVMACHLR